MSETTRILVIGGTRGTGYQIVRLLLRDGYAVRVLARDAVRAAETHGPQVEIVAGDLIRPDTLPAAMQGIDVIILTAAVSRPVAGPRAVRATVYDGTLHTLAAAHAEGFQGRFLYMSVLGVYRRSWLGMLLNLKKGNTLRWRRHAEAEIRSSGFDHTIIHAGILTDDPPGQRRIVIGQDNLPLLPRYRICRADVAEVFVQALRHPQTRNTSFDVAWGNGAAATDWNALFAGLSEGR